MQIVTESLFETPPERPGLISGIRLGRGWHDGQSHAWSRSMQAELVIDAKVFPRPRPLMVRFQVFNAALHRARHIRFESPGHAPVTMQVTTDRPVTALLQTPQHAEGVRDSRITLGLDRLDSPYLAGLSDDERLLGLSIVELVPDAPALAFPLEFTADSPAQSVLLEGWAAPEEHGTWSVGTRAVLHLPAYLSPGHPVDLVFEGCGLPLPAGRPPLRVDVVEAGVPRATWQFESATPVRRHCALPDWSANSDRRIELFIRNPWSPASLGINADARLLGVLLKRLSLAD